MATNDSSNMMSRMKDMAGRLTPVQKVALGAVVLTVIAGSLVLSRTKSTTEMGVLFTDLSSADASSVVDALAGQGVAYELTDAGRTVMVPKTDVYNLRVDMAGQGLPSANDGYALLDNQGITTSEFRQRVDYQRALEGELAKTVSALDGVKSASVHLALPDESVFVDEPSSPTASVLVMGTMSGGITDDEVQAIVHLVASSVKDMKPEGVTVVDANGAVLSSGGAAGGGAGTTRTKFIAEIEQSTAAKVTAMLSRMTGPNKVSVSVNATVDLDEVQSTSEDYTPIGTDDAGGLVKDEKTLTEQYGNATLNGDAGVLGPDGATVTPDAPVDAVTGVDGNTDYLKDEASRTYALDRTVSQTVKVPGTVTRLSVAVLVDDAAVTEEQLGAIEEMVATAAGIDADRGDTVTITRLPFDTSMITEAEKAAKEDEAAASQAQLMSMARTGAIILVIVIALFLAYRSAKQARKVTAIPIDIGELAAAYPRPNGAAPLAIESGQRSDSLALMAARPPTPEEELAVIADQRPQEVANVLRAWLNETKAGRR
jgi:flagellar M-ring protein FliF